MTGLLNIGVIAVIAALIMTEPDFRTAVPLGMPAEEARVYLTSIADLIKYVEHGEEDSLRVPSYPWLESDVGYYRLYVGEVKSRWWMPSFGVAWYVWVGISKENAVSQVIIDKYSPRHI